MRKILGIVAPFLSFVTLGCNEKLVPLIIKDVTDGDTIYFQNGKRGRIFGIDAPELKKQDGSKTSGIEYLMALKAKQKLRALLFNKQITVVRITIDKYRRFIVKLQNNNLDIGIKMVKLGLARVAYISNKPRSKFFSSDENYYKQLLEAQHYAYKNNIGLWSRKDLYKKIFPIKI